MRGKTLNGRQQEIEAQSGEATKSHSQEKAGIKDDRPKFGIEGLGEGVLANANVGDKSAQPAWERARFAR